MPNVRSTEKIILSSYIPKQLKSRLQAIAAIERISMTEAQVLLLERAVQNYERKQRRHQAKERK